MIEMERGVELSEKSRYVVVEQRNKQDLIGLSQLFVESVVDNGMPRAYDPTLDIKRHEELALKYGMSVGKTIFEEEMREDVAFHLAELGSNNSRIKLYEYEYVIDENGVLCESKGERQKVSDMFVDQESEVVGDLWLSHIIPKLEDASVGESIFTLSVKSDSVFEGMYDFVYMMIKTSDNTVKCVGVEVDLTREEEREIINRQLKFLGAPEQVFLEEEFSWMEGRGRAMFFESEQYGDFNDMFVGIVGSVVREMRGDYELGTRFGFSEFVERQRKRFDAMKEEVDGMTRSLVDKIVGGASEMDIEEQLTLSQMNFLKNNDYDLYREGIQNGFVVLACGVVNFGMESDFDEGISKLIDSNEKSWSYHLGKCNKCNRSNVEVGPCDICKSCEKKFDSGEY